ncbi:MAG: hypothetical protein K0S00_1893 [Xanthobacteraceae bacterium]|jgi:hypothetical protein|nr:hypothetical protein [Xanthobacteraceae bacterium]
MNGMEQRVFPRLWRRCYGPSSPRLSEFPCRQKIVILRCPAIGRASKDARPGAPGGPSFEARSARTSG